MPGSKQLAERYAAARKVPMNQVIGFALTTNEEIKRIEFTDDLQKPLNKWLEKSKLWHISSTIVEATSNSPARVVWKVSRSKIRYAVLCYGMPLRIPEDSSVKEQGVDKIQPEFRRNVAAVDNELALLPMIEQHLPLHGPIANWTFGVTNESLLHPTNGVLLVSRLDGPSLRIANGLIDKALDAETNGMWGRAYFDLRNISDPGYKMGDDWIRAASELSLHLGFETVVDDNPGTFPDSFPMSQIGLYIGWYAQDACGPLAQPRVEFMPGAFAYHLHSYSGRTLRSAKEGWVGPLLAKGATITMGSVDEPYLAGTPQVAIFVSRFIHEGFSFGEAAYASLSMLSWQTTVVGDPLYRPFGRTLDELHRELAQRKSPYLEWSFLKLVDLNLVAGKPMTHAIALLEGLDLTKRSAVLSEKLGDLYAADGKPSSAAHAWMQALDLQPSPQQRVRVTLELGPKLNELARQPEAYKYYQALLKNCPDYPEKLEVIRKLILYADQLHKAGDADLYRSEEKKLTAPKQP
jgi:uncharacterized protein (TIGR03790 family)